MVATARRLATSSSDNHDDNNRAGEKKTGNSDGKCIILRSLFHSMARTRAFSLKYLPYLVGVVFKLETSVIVDSCPNRHKGEGTTRDGCEGSVDIYTVSDL